MWRIIGVGLVVGLLAGCSMVRLAYTQADHAMYWWLDSYLDFSDTQSSRVREDLARLFAWHRRQELPGYASVLASVRDQAAGPVDAAAVCAVVAQARERALRVAERFAPTVAAIAPTLTAAQAEHLRRRFERRNTEWRKDWIDGPPARLRERRIERIVERAERVYGRLEDAQLAVIQANVDASVFDPRLSLRDAQRRQRDTLDTLQRLRAGDAAPDATQSLFDRSLQSPDPQYREHLERVTREGCAAVAALHNSTTVAQRAHAVRVLSGWEQDLRALASPQ